GAKGRPRFREQCLEALAPVDLLLTPTLICVPPRVSTRELRGEPLSRSLTRFTRPFNTLGWPALALPCGLAEEGLPASVQLVGPPGSDALVLAAGALLESAIAAQHAI